MLSKKIIIRNSTGLHMRPAAMFSSEMGRFTANVSLLYGDLEVNGKSIMDILASGIPCGAEVEIRCNGADEKEALNRAVQLIESNFSE